MSQADPVRLGTMLLEAVAHERAGRFDRAEPLVQHLLAADPDHPEALHLMAMIALARQDLPRARTAIARAATQRAGSAAIHRTAIEIYRRSGMLDAALAAGARALAIEPDDPVALSMIAAVQLGRLDLAGAVASARAALALRPEFAEAHFELATALLLQGDFAAGWAEYEYRYGLVHGPRLPPTRRPHWRGERMAEDELMLIADQGYGDVIQFARFIPWAAQRCPNLVVAADREVQGIIAQLCPGVPILQHWPADPAFAAYCPLSGLPFVFGADLSNLPPAPYLRADPARAAVWAARLAGVCPPGRRRIGIAWAGRPTHHNDSMRSLRLDMLGPLAAREDVMLVSLQKGPAQAQVAEYAGTAPLLDLAPAIADFGDTMAIIESLDLVVAVDTAVAHLAGAMGRTVWILLPFLPDWRWLLERTDSPWYPLAKLFRQPAPLQWAPVVNRIAEGLARMHE